MRLDLYMLMLALCLVVWECTAESETPQETQAAEAKSDDDETTNTTKADKTAVSSPKDEPQTQDNQGQSEGLSRGMQSGDGTTSLSVKGTMSSKPEVTVGSTEVSTVDTAGVRQQQEREGSQQNTVAPKQSSMAQGSISSPSTNGTEGRTEAQDSESRHVELNGSPSGAAKVSLGDKSKGGPAQDSRVPSIPKKELTTSEVSSPTDTKIEDTKLTDISSKLSPARSPTPMEQDTSHSKGKDDAKSSGDISKPIEAAGDTKMSQTVSSTEVTVSESGSSPNTITITKNQDAKKTVNDVSSPTEAISDSNTPREPTPGFESNVDTNTLQPIVSKALPLHHSIEKTDGILCSSSLFALAALATLAVAAAAPAH